MSEFEKKAQRASKPKSKSKSKCNLTVYEPSASAYDYRIYQDWEDYERQVKKKHHRSKPTVESSRDYALEPPTKERRTVSNLSPPRSLPPRSLSPRQSRDLEAARSGKGDALLMDTDKRAMLVRQDKEFANRKYTPKVVEPNISSVNPDDSFKKQKVLKYRDPDDSFKKQKALKYGDSDDSFKKQKALTYGDSDDSLKKQKDLKYGDYIPAEEEGSLSDEIYIVRQKWGVCSIFFSLVQTIVLTIMMTQCGIAPLKINPMIGPYPDTLSAWGAKNTVLILDENEWWRLFTPLLLHAGIIHLLCNVAVQLETGLFFEKEWGSARWLCIYLFSGLGSSILSVVVMPNALSVGSSGAIMGLFGGKLSEIIMRMCERIRTKQDRVGHQVRKEQCLAVTCSVSVIMAFSFIPFVDWAAHLGGLVAGIVVGIFVFAQEIEPLLWRLAWSAVGAAISIIGFTLALDYMYSGNVQAIPELADVCAYYQQALEDYVCHCQRN